VLPLCEELGIGFVPWGPLGTGHLTGKVARTSSFDVNDFRADPRASRPRRWRPTRVWSRRSNSRRGQRRHRRAGGARLAPRKRAKHRADLRHAPPGQREGKPRAADVSLSDEDIAAIEARLARIEVTGERLPPALLKVTYR
jgi:hypothetical protein